VERMSSQDWQLFVGLSVAILLTVLLMAVWL
jgi:hypothetical protein